ncbi:hypothetical protein KJ969_02620 [Patescibacteria group bacterium]|nr:hypothetical protein [Patescibacteria group bacterium]MBU1922369.1 hypothetical protein [Patescibacteria group bacterium]
MKNLIILKKINPRREERGNCLGFTLVETLLVVALIATIVGITTPVYRTFQETRQIEYITQEIVYTLRTAQGNSAAGLDDNKYGVYFTGSAFELFKGSAYPGTEILISKQIPNTLEIYEINLTPTGTDEVVFNKNTGTTDNYGTIKVRIKGLADAFYTIVISNLGMVFAVSGDY